MKLAINGLGRIGRLVLRQLVHRDDIQVVAVNDVADAGTLAHLIKYDSMHGKADFRVSHDEDSLVLGSRRIRAYREREPEAVPFGEVGADLVLECSGTLRTRAGLARLLRGGVRHVLVSDPVEDADLTVVMGANHEDFDVRRHGIVSCAGSASNCAVLLAKVLDEAFGVDCGLITAVEAYANDQRILDLPHPDLRLARAASLSMIPAPTEAAGTVGRVLPRLAGRVDGLAVRVPTPDVSLVDLSVTTGRDATVESIREAFRSAAEHGPLKGFLEVAEDEIVSVDLRGNPASCVFDPSLTRVMTPRYIKVFGWYDNEYGYASRMKDLAVHALARIQEEVR